MHSHMHLLLRYLRSYEKKSLRQLRMLMVQAMTLLTVLNCCFSACIPVGLLLLEASLHILCLYMRLVWRSHLYVHMLERTLNLYAVEEHFMHHVRFHFELKSPHTQGCQLLVHAEASHIFVSWLYFFYFPAIYVLLVEHDITHFTFSVWQSICIIPVKFYPFVYHFWRLQFYLL